MAQSKNEINMRKAQIEDMNATFMKSRMGHPIYQALMGEVEGADEFIEQLFEARNSTCDKYISGQINLDELKAEIKETLKDSNLQFNGATSDLGVALVAMRNTILALPELTLHATNRNMMFSSNTVSGTPSDNKAEANAQYTCN